MVSAKNKQRLRSLVKRTGELATAAGKRVAASEAAAEAEGAKREAGEIARNPEPNDREDAELLAAIKRNHQEVMAKLRGIEDELSRPMDEAPGAPAVESTGFDWIEELYF